MEKRITVRQFITIMRLYGIEAAELSPAEVRSYKNKWYRTFVSLTDDNDRLRAVCLGIDDDRLVPGDCNRDVREYDFRGFLWYVYRCEAVADYRKGGYAKTAFNKQPKKEMILVDNFSRENTAFLIKGAPDMKAAELDRLTDVTITDIDFEWTYSKTHEERWFGPYFHKK